MNLIRIVIIISVGWVASEAILALVKRSRGRESTVLDRSSLRLLWVTITLSIMVGVLLGIRGIGLVRSAFPAISCIGIALIILGLTVRWIAILSLRRYFTVNVAVFSDHKLISTGIYKRIRHPAYAGSLLSFLGLGLSFSNWLSAAVIFVPILFVFLYRIRVEEKALAQAFGEKYLEYAKATKRLVPWIY
jgi:protein-S-isoprenylcysteine O-methyltransferase Ste14